MLRSCWAAAVVTAMYGTTRTGRCMATVSASRNDSATSGSSACQVVAGTAAQVLDLEVAPQAAPSTSAGTTRTRTPGRA
jgi:hypothetical protein